MTKGRKTYPNCISHVAPESHGLNYHSALLTKFYRNYSTSIVRVCVTPFHPMTAKLNVHRKSNKQVHFGSKAMASLDERLCHNSPKCSNPLLEELLAYLPTRFPSHVFDLFAFESSDNESVHSILSPVSAFYCNDIFFCNTFELFPVFVQLQILYHNHGHMTVSKYHRVLKGPRRPTTDPECPTNLRSRPPLQVTPTAPALPQPSRQGTVPTI